MALVRQDLRRFPTKCVRAPELLFSKDATNISSGENPSNWKRERTQDIITDLGVIRRKGNAVAAVGGYTVIETI